MERVKIKKQDFAKRSNQRRKDVLPTVASILTYSLSQKKIVQKVVEKVAQRPVKAVAQRIVKAIAQKPVKRAVERPVPNPPMMCVAYV
jgi:ABC-type siderophore export system fused ATPase/permease subunit